MKSEIEIQIEKDRIREKEKAKRKAFRAQKMEKIDQILKGHVTQKSVLVYGKKRLCQNAYTTKNQ